MNFTDTAFCRKHDRLEDITHSKFDVAIPQTPLTGVGTWGLPGTPPPGTYIRHVTLECGATSRIVSASAFSDGVRYREGKP